MINEGLYLEGAPLHGFPQLSCVDVLEQIVGKLSKTKLFREKERIIHFCFHINKTISPKDKEKAMAVSNSIIQQIAFRYFLNNEYGTIFMTILKIFDELEWKNESQCFSILLNLLETHEKMGHFKEQIYLGLLDKILVYISGKMAPGTEETIGNQLQNDSPPLKILTKKGVRLSALMFLYQMMKRSTSDFVSFLYLDVLFRFFS